MGGRITNKELKALIEDMRNKDTQVFLKILTNFEKLIELYAFRLKGYVEDYRQSAFLELYEVVRVINLERFNDEGEMLSHYLAVCIRNHFFKFSKDIVKGKIILAKAIDAYRLEDALDELSKPIFEDARNVLTDLQFRIIVYKYVYRLSDADIADMLKVTRQAVNRAKNRALNILRDTLGGAYE